VNHFYKDIQGWFKFSEPYHDAVREAQNGAIFVELGCWKGQSSTFMGVEIANSGKEIVFHCVDHWRGSVDDAHQSDPELDRIYDIFQGNMAQINGIELHTHRISTVAASHLFGNGSVDFVWIDASHEYDDVVADIRAWWPKVKVGGVIGGDDLPMDGVKRAVDDIFPHHEVGSERGWKW